MAKQIDVSQATEWSDEEAAYNVRYLQDRTRYAEADAILAARSGTPVPLPDEDVPEPIKPSQAEGSPDPNAKPDTTKMNPKEVMTYVDKDAVRAGEALVAEIESEKSRPRLIEQLEKLTG